MKKDIFITMLVVLVVGLSAYIIVDMIFENNAKDNNKVEENNIIEEIKTKEESKVELLDLNSDLVKDLEEKFDSVKKVRIGGSVIEEDFDGLINAVLIYLSPKKTTTYSLDGKTIATYYITIQELKDGYKKLFGKSFDVNNIGPVYYWDTYEFGEDTLTVKLIPIGSGAVSDTLYHTYKAEKVNDEIRLYKSVAQAYGYSDYDNDGLDIHIFNIGDEGNPIERMTLEEYRKFDTNKFLENNRAILSTYIIVYKLDTTNNNYYLYKLEK